MFVYWRTISDFELTFWQSTTKRSALRITREAELLGGELSAYHSRENLVLRAKFLREDLPYFTELLGEVITKSRFASTYSQQEESRTQLLLTDDSTRTE